MTLTWHESTGPQRASLTAWGSWHSRCSNPGHTSGSRFGSQLWSHSDGCESPVLHVIDNENHCVLISRISTSLVAHPAALYSFNHSFTFESVLGPSRPIRLVDSCKANRNAA